MWVHKKCDICIHWNIIWPPPPKGNAALWDIIGGPGEHYTKWNKPGTEGQIVNDPTFMSNLK